MKNQTVVTSAAIAAGFVPRPAVPTSVARQGTGVPAGSGSGRRERGLTHIPSIEHDSAMAALTV